MTKEEELAEEQIKKWDSVLYPQICPVALVKDFIRKAFHAGFEAGRPKWHDIRKNPGDLPETLHPVYAKLDSGTYVFAYCVNKIWHGNDDGIILYHGNGKSEVIAWCEIPKFEEGMNEN